MTRCGCCNHKFLLNCCNFLFLICGIVLIVSGFYLFTDIKRILLSRLLAATSDQLNDLPQPLFYYISIGLCVAGLVALLASILGFWASCLNTYCCLSIYFLTVVILLLAESVVCLAITLWPHCLGINLDASKMVRAIQGFYGIPGREQFTIAMDLAQTRFGCCGMNSASNYDTSLWKLQGYGQRDWSVPLSCCRLDNAADTLSYLDPKPTNETGCESLQYKEYEHFRYVEPCLSYLDNWYREQYVIFLAASLIIAIVEFGVLFCIILNCTKVTRKTIRMDNEIQHNNRRVGKSRNTLVENIYETDVELRLPSGLSLGDPRTVSSILSEDFKEVYIQPRDLYKQRHNTTFKPISSDYSVPATTRSYLV